MNSEALKALPSGKSAIAMLFIFNVDDYTSQSQSQRSQYRWI